ncbi:hypothetical protein CASFOL_003472 [Castilleja foliolosa]|uniref:Uncharacterized protein n=1 Tax=Castilleja foliolosa TaxID=1961234 RepID=A0ABD3EHX4_9LAMI
MAKFNVVQKRRRAAIATQKRLVHGDLVSGKLHQRIQPQSISGKRQRKNQRRWRREQNEVAKKGLITMQDVEMAVSDGSQAVNKTHVKFSMKKSSKLRVKQLKNKVVKTRKSLKKLLDKPQHQHRLTPWWSRR